jgi:prevent-host-death family protein
MRRNISTQELKAKIGEVVDSVRLRSEHYIIERRGKPVAALVPVALEERYEREREEFFDLMERVAERNRHLSPETIEEMISQAVAEVRQAKRQARQNK